MEPLRHPLKLQKPGVIPGRRAKWNHIYTKRGSCIPGGACPITQHEPNIHPTLLPTKPLRESYHPILLRVDVSRNRGDILEVPPEFGLTTNKGMNKSICEIHLLLLNNLQQPPRECSSRCVVHSIRNLSLFPPKFKPPQLPNFQLDCR